MSIEKIKNMLELSSTEHTVIPPTLIYNEGWMLRLVLDWFSRHPPTNHPLSIPSDGRWYSEALLASPFLPRERGDELGESYTHAHGVIGHFEIGKHGNGDVSLLPGATHFVVIEAKMFSRLSSEVAHAKYYNQAARTVACIAHVLKEKRRRPEDFRLLGFCLIAPQSRIDEGIFTHNMSLDSIEGIVEKRVYEYNGSKDGWYHDWFLPTIKVITIKTISWEQVIKEIRAVDADTGKELEVFYHLCLTYNRVGSEQYSLCYA